MSVNNYIDITGLDKVKLLTVLWHSAKSFAMTPGSVAGFAEMLSKDKAEDILNQNNGYVDYFKGRPIKIDFSQNKINPRMYDRDAGEGKCAEVVMKLRFETDMHMKENVWK